MRKFAYFLCCAFLAIALISCTTLGQRVKGAEELIKPGDKIGEMTLERGSPTLPYPNLWQFCDYLPDSHEPVAATTDCNVPKMSGMVIAFGWLARQSKFASNWDAMTWELQIDGQKIDLQAFEWYESNYTVRGEDNKSREWLIDLKNLSPGAHTLQLTQTMKTAVDDGMNVYQPGKYENLAHFTVLEKAVYKELSSAANTGQHSYSSVKAGLDFLLYLPSTYGQDPQQKWPLIVYLHGAHLRGAPLELLAREPVPQKLAKENDFPFIVVSPLADGGYEFWSKAEVVKPLFTLLEEIRAKYAVDAGRIYLTGSDMGGNGVWAIGLQHPDYFAALAPIAGYASYPFAVPENICDLKDVPVWVFHGNQDPYVPVKVEQDLVDALTACGGNAQITISQHMKNDVPFNVYADPELYDWFLMQSRE